MFIFRDNAGKFANRYHGALQEIPLCPACRKLLAEFICRNPRLWNKLWNIDCSWWAFISVYSNADFRLLFYPSVCSFLINNFCDLLVCISYPNFTEFGDAESVEKGSKTSGQPAGDIAFFEPSVDKVRLATRTLHPRQITCESWNFHQLKKF